MKQDNTIRNTFVCVLGVISETFSGLEIKLELTNINGIV